MEDDEFELDENGRPRRKRVFRHGDTVHYSMTMMDAFFGGGARSTFTGGSGDTDRTGTNDGANATAKTKFCVDARGQLGGFRPGWIFPANNLDSDLRAKADAEYEARRRRSASAWKRKGKVGAPLTSRPKGRSRGGAYPVPRPGDGQDDGEGYDDVA